MDELIESEEGPESTGTLPPTRSDVPRQRRTGRRTTAADGDQDSSGGQASDGSSARADASAATSGKDDGPRPFGAGLMDAEPRTADVAEAPRRRRRPAARKRPSGRRRAQASVAETSAETSAETATAETVVPEAAESPVAQSPVAESPVAESPVAESPVAESAAEDASTTRARPARRGRRRGRRGRGGRSAASASPTPEAEAEAEASTESPEPDDEFVDAPESAGDDTSKDGAETVPAKRRSRRRRTGRRPADVAAPVAAPSAAPNEEVPATVSPEESAPESEGDAEPASGRTRSRRTAETTAAKPRPVKRILVDALDKEEVRIAVLENGKPEELYYERPYEKKYLGNVYRGRVVNIEPAIQAAFVELGIGRNGFLHVSDVLPAYKDAKTIPIENLSQRLADRRRLRMQDVLENGQEVLVQISKDAIGAKGPSLTTYVSVPGKFLVLMPGVNRHGVSKRIQNDADRASLRKKLASLDPPRGMGFILRTAAEECEPEELEKDFKYLMGVWDEICGKVDGERRPGLIYAESELVIRTLRDLFGPDVDEILVSGPGVYEQAREFLLEVRPEAAKGLTHYTGNTPLFTKFGVEEEIEKIYNRRVPLPSGGHIVVEQTEALVAIDVNSGKYRCEEDLESTALNTNLEAADEIARQLRLRDLGGVIINDFIDMEVEANRRRVERALGAALRRDRARSWITRITRFGIIEMTRQRVRPSFERANHEPCTFCKGLGFVKSPRSSGIHILRHVRAGLAAKRRKLCEIVAPPDVVEYLVNERREYLTELESEYRKSVRVIADRSLSPDQYEIRYR